MIGEHYLLLDFTKEILMEVLRGENLYKVYGEGGNKVEALKNVNISIEKGEFVAIMGPSGSGKTTLLHAIGGLEKPTSGNVLLEGQNLYEKSNDELAILRRRDIGIVNQFYNLIPILNVEENILLPILLDGRKANEERLNQIIFLLGLENKKHYKPSELSGGQQQRTAIARAIINAPSIILADEPTGNLDSQNSKEIIQLFKKTNKKYGQTIVIITHDEDIAIQADRIITMDDGEIVRNEE